MFLSLDLAVGAPYEGGGVVYIYNGASFGMHHVPSQRIIGKNLHKGLKAFGWSFSRPWDVNRDRYQGRFGSGSFKKWYIDSFDTLAGPTHHE